MAGTHDPPPMREPWLIAAWQGMGAVGLLAVDRLVHGVAARPLEAAGLSEWSATPAVHVVRGLLQPAGSEPSGLYVAPAQHEGPRDLLLFEGAVQPPSRHWPFAEALLDAVAAYEPALVVTCAAMAAPIAPEDVPRVFAAATSVGVLARLPDTVEALQEGEIGGMNGVLLGAAAARGLDGLCLLGEFPYFAAGVPHPKPAAAILRVLMRMTAREVDTTDLELQGRELEKRLQQHLERLQAMGRGPGEGGEESLQLGAPEAESVEAESGVLDAADHARIQKLFHEAEADREKALALKAELDRLRVFREYEDRFLDLFQRGE